MRVEKYAVHEYADTLCLIKTIWAPKFQIKPKTKII